MPLEYVILARLAPPSDYTALPGAAFAEEDEFDGVSTAEVRTPQIEELSPPVKPVPPPPPDMPEPLAIPSNSAIKKPEAALPLVAIDEVPSALARPDLPTNLQLKGIPLPRPKISAKDSLPSEDSPVLPLPSEELPATSADPLELMWPAAPWERTPKPTSLLPEPVLDPGIIYVVPFVSIMVPPDVQERVFDQFIDTLNQHGADLQLKFVIFKSERNDKNRLWLEDRKYVIGEIYGYVEDSGCCSTELRTRIRLNYFRAQQTVPILNYEDSFRTYFEHDGSTLAVERQKLADQIASKLVAELLKSLQR